MRDAPRNAVTSDAAVAVACAALDAAAARCAGADAQPVAVAARQVAAIVAAAAVTSSPTAVAAAPSNVAVAGTTASATADATVTGSTTSAASALQPPPVLLAMRAALRFIREHHVGVLSGTGNADRAEPFAPSSTPSTVSPADDAAAVRPASPTALPATTTTMATIATPSATAIATTTPASPSSSPVVEVRVPDPLAECGHSYDSWSASAAPSSWRSADGSSTELTDAESTLLQCCRVLRNGAAAAPSLRRRIADGPRAVFAPLLGIIAREPAPHPSLAAAAAQVLANLLVGTGSAATTASGAADDEDRDADVAAARETFWSLAVPHPLSHLTAATMGTACREACAAMLYMCTLPPRPTTGPAIATTIASSAWRERLVQLVSTSTTAAALLVPLLCPTAAEDYDACHGDRSAWIPLLAARIALTGGLWNELYRLRPVHGWRSAVLAALVDAVESAPLITADSGAAPATPGCLVVCQRALRFAIEQLQLGVPGATDADWWNAPSSHAAMMAEQRECSLLLQLLATIAEHAGDCDALAATLDGALAPALALLHGAFRWRPPDPSARRDDHDAALLPVDSVRCALVRLIGNLCFRRTANQDSVRESGLLPALLALCTLDERAPRLREWSLLCIRNLCEGNQSNQALLRALECRGIADADAAAWHRLGVHVEVDEATHRLRISRA